MGANSESHPVTVDRLSSTGYNDSDHGLTIESAATLVDKDIDAQENGDLREEHTPLTNKGNLLISLHEE